MSAFWGSATYSGGDPVPLRSRRCTATVKEAAGVTHPCRSHVDHGGDHKCVCGKTWARKAGV